MEKPLDIQPAAVSWKRVLSLAAVPIALFLSFSTSDVAAGSGRGEEVARAIAEGKARRGLRAALEEIQAAGTATAFNGGERMRLEGGSYPPAMLLAVGGRLYRETADGERLLLAGGVAKVRFQNDGDYAIVQVTSRASEENATCEATIGSELRLRGEGGRR